MPPGFDPIGGVIYAVLTAPFRFLAWVFGRKS